MELHGWRELKDQLKEDEGLIKRPTHNRVGRCVRTQRTGAGHRPRCCSYQEHRIDAAVILRVVGNLCVLAPDDLARGRDESKV